MSSIAPLHELARHPDPSIVSVIEQRTSTNNFDPRRPVPDKVITELVTLATRAPSAFHLQNWRFIAVRTADAKQRLRRLAWDQPKVTDAAVTFIVTGLLPTADSLRDRLLPSVRAGFMPPHVVDSWVEAARGLYSDSPNRRRDEAIRSATFAAATMMFAAAAFDLATGPMSGFDPDGVAGEFGLGDGEIPVLLMAVGHPAPGNWPQKPRRPISEVLTLA